MTSNLATATARCSRHRAVLILASVAAVAFAVWPFPAVVVTTVAIVAALAGEAGARLGRAVAIRAARQEGGQ